MSIYDIRLDNIRVLCDAVDVNDPDDVDRKIQTIYAMLGDAPDAEIRDEFDELACDILGRPRFNELRVRYPDATREGRAGIMGACMGELSHLRSIVQRVREAID